MKPTIRRVIGSVMNGKEKNMSKLEKIRLQLVFIADDLNEAKQWQEVEHIEERIRKLADKLEEIEL